MEGKSAPKYKKLVNARDAISNMMGSRMSHIPISSVGVNDLNFTLDVGIADKKAALPSGAEEYKQKLEEIVGNVPIRVQYGEYATALPEIITQHIALSSPLKQFKSGIASLNVKCKQDFLLIIKSKDDLPACTRPITALSLLERGWGQITSPFDTTTDLLDSKILGGTISKYHYDLQSKIILINVQTASDGNLTVTIPRKLIDAQVGDTDAQFFVLEDGQEILYKEIHKTIQDRILSIPIQKGIEQIEIIGANQT
ncbi:MAG: hypothetical protein HY222_01665 [Thaumarchaeota archaeon]|nr:hypothetical protein [Nitrososphaerota archaeon]